MVVNFGKLIVGHDEIIEQDEHHQPFESVEDIPGWEKRGDKLEPEVLKYLTHILDKPRYATQVLDVGKPGIVQTFEAGEKLGGKTGEKQKRISAAYGFKMTQLLGLGKDGQTYEATRYFERPELQGQKYIIKILSSYAKTYKPNIKIFYQILDRWQKYHQEQDGDKKFTWHKMIQREVHFKSEFMWYQIHAPYVEVSNTPQVMLQNYAEIATFNKWCIQNTGMIFWDLGFTNGRNFMLDPLRGNRLMWVDYGGAGLVRTDNFEGICSFLEIKKLETINGNQKEMLINADTSFVMGTFLWNLDYWWQKNEKVQSDGAEYSSITQTKKSLCDLLVKNVLEESLHSKVARDLYLTFKDKNWLDHVTWKRIATFLKEYKI